MYLKSLQINGFKSFAQKTNLEFKSNISAIVGPNGSGKSNVAESFRFVLGEQNMKNMRGKKGEDLIFHGKNSRLNRASVKVIFDNSDKALNIDYTEVIIERIVYRDGNNEYLINGTRVRVKDVLELLNSANIGSSGHHIISQGEADKILSISPKERKSVIEEALGLKSFVVKKQESERKLEKTDLNLKEVKTREKINAPRIKFLEREVQKIKRGEELRNELADLYKIFFPEKKKLNAKISQIDLAIKNKEAEKTELENKIKAKNISLTESKNSQKSDGKKAEEISKIEQEISEQKNKKEEIQKIIFKNDILIEGELKKEEFFNSQKERVEENLKKYQNKFQAVKNILLTKLKNLISDQNIIDAVSKEILSFFGIREDGSLEKNFDLDLVADKKRENKELQEKIKSLEEVLESLYNKVRILKMDDENSDEIFSQEIEIEILKLEKILEKIIAEIHNLNSEKISLENKLNDFRREESFAISFFGHNFLEQIENDDFDKKEESEEKNILEKILRIRILLENIQTGDAEKILAEYEELKERQEFIAKEIADLELSKDNLIKLIDNLNNEIEIKFRAGIEKINSEFAKFFSTLFSGGRAEIFLVNIPIKKSDEDEMQEFELGIDLKVSLPNKKISGLSMLSGGERSLTSIALLFAMSSTTPPPFIILDETDAALDEANSKRYADMVEKLAEHSQLILITHNRETMSRAGLLYGVTMDQGGTSKLLSVSFDEGQKYAK